MQNDTRKTASKPFFIRQRIILLQAVAFAIALLLLATALLINQRIVRNIELPLQRLDAILQEQEQIVKVQREFQDAASRAYLHPGQGVPRNLAGSASALRHAADSLAQLPLSARQKHTLAEILSLEDRLTEQARASRDLIPGSPRAVAAFDELRDTSIQIFTRIDEIKQSDLAGLSETAARLPALTHAFYALFAAFLVFVSFLLWGFRRLEQRHLWNPVESLQGMIDQVRRGNLDVHAEPPASVEFGSLLRGFLAMADELARMRGGLEQMVDQRTAELVETQHELIHAAKLSSLGQLVSGIAHEINNPLTSIMGFAELQLARQIEDPALRRSLETIREQALRLKLVVSNLSAFARSSPPQIKRMDLRQVLDQIGEFHRYALGASGIRLHEERTPQSLWVRADHDQLVQAVFNLVLNAQQTIADSGGTGDIWISCGAEHGRAWLAVRDNGTGMPAEVAARAFDPFFSTRPTGKGSGLGLSIANDILQKHGGTLALESALGRGTTARLSLPLAEAPESSEAQPVAPNVPAGSGEVRVLVVDDEEAITGLISAWLNRRGYAFTVLHNPCQFETVLDLRKFDLVLCDLKMPGRTGLQLLESLRRSRPEMANRFLLMTGNPADIDPQEEARLAGVPVLRKPFTLARLAEAVDSLLCLRPLSER
jgi:signal transduction histidine kinase/CheY-like chemotaxis protein